jgi:hypothetical protein
MKLVKISVDALEVSQDLARTGSAKQFEERLRSSIQAIGLTEPLKVAPLTAGRYLVIDGAMRFRAVQSIRAAEPSRFSTVAAYVLDYDRRYELRYQSDIYQDLLPSQLAQLVEHLHATEHVRKVDIARYIGVSPATLRNYTGLWRLIKRGDLFAAIVELMDVEVIPSSNPYAWLRLTSDGIRKVLEENFSDGEKAETWVQRMCTAAQQGDITRFPIKFVEATTDALPAEYYREGEDLRLVKRDIGQRRGKEGPSAKPKVDYTPALRNLTRVSRQSSEPVLRTAALSLKEYLQ